MQSKFQDKSENFIYQFSFVESIWRKQMSISIIYIMHKNKYTRKTCIHQE